MEREYIGWVAAIGSLGGVSYHLWRGEAITIRRWVGAIGLSAVGSVLSLLWQHTDMAGEPYKLGAVSILCGIGATTLVDGVLAALRARALQFVAGPVRPRREDWRDDDNEEGAIDPDRDSGISSYRMAGRRGDSRSPARRRRDDE